MTHTHCYHATVDVIDDYDGRAYEALFFECGYVIPWDGPTSFHGKKVLVTVTCETDHAPPKTGQNGQKGKGTP